MESVEFVELVTIRFDLNACYSFEEYLTYFERIVILNHLKTFECDWIPLKHYFYNDHSLTNN